MQRHKDSQLPISGTTECPGGLSLGDETSEKDRAAYVVTPGVEAEVATHSSPPVSLLLPL